LPLANSFRHQDLQGTLTPKPLLMPGTRETPRPKVGASWRKFSQCAARTCLAMPSTLLAYFDHSSPTKSRGILVILRNMDRLGA
jgi:hypothetical protein